MKHANLALAVFFFCALAPSVVGETFTRGNWTYRVSQGEASILRVDGLEGHVEIPSNLGGAPVVRIESYIFGFSNTLVTGVRIPDSVRSLATRAFYACTSLRYVIIGKSVTSIASEVFFECYRLNAILFLGNAPSIAYAGLPDIVYAATTSTGWDEMRAVLPWTPTPLPFRPVGYEAKIDSSGVFSFRWSGTGGIPMNVKRSNSPSGPWTTVSSLNEGGFYADLAPASGSAFYRAILP